MPDPIPVPDGDNAGQHLFIVRIWYEARRPTPQPWRGSVEHVPSGQRIYFASLGDLNDFISLRLNGRFTSEGEQS
jgi:hypothetical protein